MRERRGGLIVLFSHTVNGPRFLSISFEGISRMRVASLRVPWLRSTCTGTVLLSLSLSLLLSLSLTLSLRHDGDTCAENNLVDESSIFFFAEDTRVSRVHEIIFSPSRKKNPFFFKTTPSAAEEISSYFGLRPIYVNMQ